MQTNIKLSYLYWHHFAVNQTEPRPDGAGSFSVSMWCNNRGSSIDTQRRVFQYLDHFSSLSPLVGVYVYMCNGLPQEQMKSQGNYPNFTVLCHTAFFIIFPCCQCMYLKAVCDPYRLCCGCLSHSFRVCSFPPLLNS